MRNVVIAALLSCTLGTAANAQQFTMKISSPTINDATQEWAKEFAAGLKARVGDKIKVEFYPASQLGQIPATSKESPWERSRRLHLRAGF
jgi:C4-dicarboxylate-binding protein DctP